MKYSEELTREFTIACREGKKKKFSNIVLKMFNNDYPPKDFEEGFRYLCSGGHIDMLEDFLRVYPIENMSSSTLKDAVMSTLAYMSHYGNNKHTPHKTSLFLLENEHIASQVNLQAAFFEAIKYSPPEVIEKILELNQKDKKNLMVNREKNVINYLYETNKHWVIEHFIEQGIVEPNDPKIQSLIKHQPQYAGNLPQFLEAHIDKKNLQQLLPVQQNHTIGLDSVEMTEAETKSKKAKIKI